MIPPQILMEDLPLSLAAAQTIILGRQAAEEIIKGRDDRLLVIVGPCSIHDTKAAIEYGTFLFVLFVVLVYGVCEYRLLKCM